ncbi:polyprenyl synthetase family protein [Streptomyces albicerus]|uniref:polyprenyl synthetase family protein n=1 Tax=Streptomyces albicerus TaxID=2569859 RepID=UPI001CEDEA74|nr:polyprenyl synthetase family protein [Streptomyces albicerus]
MNPKSYMDIYQQHSADIEAEMTAAVERLGPSSTAVKNAVAKLLQHQKFTYPLQVLPMLVHAAETGAPEPAVPLSAVHILWWTSACYLDDLADGEGTRVSGVLSEHEALLASMITGHVLPLHVVRSQQVPEPVRGALTAEVVNCWIVATEGQLNDMSGDADDATTDSTITVYRGKSGAPFGMISAMGAILAGADHERIQLWREFGDVFGILWQLFNDQEDILSGRNEDLRNGTVTYLLACALEEASPRSRAHILNLHAASRNADGARAELTNVLLAPAVLRRYRKDLHKFRDEAHRILGRLGGDEAYVPVLRDLVDRSAQMLLLNSP